MRQISIVYRTFEKRWRNQQLIIEQFKFRTIQIEQKGLMLMKQTGKRWLNNLIPVILLEHLLVPFN